LNISGEFFFKGTKEAEFIENISFIHISPYEAHRHYKIKHLILSFSAAEIFGQAGRKILKRVGNTAWYKEGWGEFIGQANNRQPMHEMSCNATLRKGIEIRIMQS
jgi:hypothetical protein